MQPNRTFLVLSGKISHNEESLYDFWIGFINIQKSLNTNDDIVVVAHTWSIQHLKLLKDVYNLKKILRSNS
jgi:hypothetical protein